MTNGKLRLQAMVALTLYSLTLLSCGIIDSPEAELRTDVPQMALYAAAFNTSQSRYRISVSYDQHLAENLPEQNPKPALVIGRYLKNSQVRSYFQSLDHLFSELVLNQSSFYPGLLELGNHEGRQLLLPVSFNLPLIVFKTTLDQSMADGFVIDLSELESKGKELNKADKNTFTTMGFGPRWSTDFLYSTVELYGAGFKEGQPLKWNRDGLIAALNNIRSWSERANGSVTKEDEFQFKYLYLPGYKSVEEGRIGYAAMDSSELFIVAEERRPSLSFRWLSKDGAVPVDDNIVYAGICRDGQGKPAAEAFLKWFYSEDTQKSILEEARRFRSMESSFGIAGGFSSIRAVNEKLFPLFYPSLLGKMPPAHYIKAPNILPSAWPEIKESIVLPFLLEATGPTPPSDPNVYLEMKMQAWLKRKTNG